MKFLGRLKFWNFLWLVRRVSWVRVGKNSNQSKCSKFRMLENRPFLRSATETWIWERFFNPFGIQKDSKRFEKIQNVFQKVSKRLNRMNADLDRLQGGFKMNRFSIEPMILILNTFFQQNSICEKDNTDYIFSVDFFEIITWLRISWSFI